MRRYILSIYIDQGLKQAAQLPFVSLYNLLSSFITILTVLAKYVANSGVV